LADKLASDDLVAALKAAAEPTRLRILTLLAAEELNVKDLTQILSQSQPRISRHLKLLVESSLIERFQEGSWVYFHVSDQSQGGNLVRRVLDLVAPNDPTLARDHERLHKLKREREDNAQRYFKDHAGEWDEIRNLYVPEDAVEEAMRAVLGAGPFDLFVDLGTGTGRVLEIFADAYRRGLGLDVNQTMLSYARSKLAAAALNHAEVRHGDLYNLSLPDQAADGVVMHQVLHYLSEPSHAIREAARILAPGGRLLVVDFAPHDLEFLRRDHAHERLGFTDEQMRMWCKAAGLQHFDARTLKPIETSKDQKLTVTIWTAEQPKTKRRGATKRLAAAAEEMQR